MKPIRAILIGILAVFMSMLFGFVYPMYAAPAAIPDLSGTWEGRLFQDPGGTQDDFVFRMELSQHGDGVEGTSRIEVPGQPQYYAVMTLQGHVDASGFTFDEQTIVEQNPEPNTRWCVKHSTLALTTKEGRQSLEGSWTAPDCSPGQLTVSRAAPLNSVTLAPTAASQSIAAQPPTPTDVLAQPAAPGGPVARIVGIDPSRATLGQPIVVDLNVSGANFPQCDQTFRAPVRVMLVMDASGSMGLSNLVEPAHQAALTFVGLLDTQQDEVGLMQFSDGVDVLQKPTRDFDAVRAQIVNVGSDSGTNTTGAIVEASQLLLSSQDTSSVFQPVILLLTDGRPNDSTSAIQAAKDAIAKGILVLTVNAGDTGGESVLQQMVQNPATDYFFAPSAADLQGAFEQAFKTFERLALAGINVEVTERLAPGFIADTTSLDPADGKVEGNTIVWQRARLGRNEQVSFSYRILPATGAAANLSEGQLVSYDDCNKQRQQINNPPGDQGVVSVSDPAPLSFPTVELTKPFVSATSRPSPWIWVGIWSAIVVVASIVAWLVLRRR